MEAKTPKQKTKKLARKQVSIEVSHTTKKFTFNTTDGDWEHLCREVSVFSGVKEKSLKLWTVDG